MTNFLLQDNVKKKHEEDGKAVMEPSIISFPAKQPQESLINQIQSRIRSKIPFFSIEFFPPRTPTGGRSFVRLLDRYSEGSPLFCDITWHANGRPEDDSLTSSVIAAGIANNSRQLQTMLHIICVGMNREEIRIQLRRAKNLGIRNILALRGDLKRKSLFSSVFCHSSNRFLFLH